MNPTTLLAQLHTLDLELDDKNTRIRAIDATLANDTTAHARAAQDAAHKQLAELSSAQRDRELEAQTLDAKIREVEQRLYNGRVTNPKELESLEKDLQMHKRQRGTLDETRLDLMDAIDQAQKRADEMSRTLALVEATHANEVALLTHERETLVARLAHANESHTHTRASLDANVLRQYDQLRRAKAGRAIAILKRDTCGACGVIVPTGLISRVSIGETIVTCPSCGRILAM